MSVLATYQTINSDMTSQKQEQQQIKNGSSQGTAGMPEISATNSPLIALILIFAMQMASEMGTLSAGASQVEQLTNMAKNLGQAVQAMPTDGDSYGEIMQQQIAVEAASDAMSVLTSNTTQVESQLVTPSVGSMEAERQGGTNAIRILQQLERPLR